MSHSEKSDSAELPVLSPFAGNPAPLVIDGCSIRDLADHLLLGNSIGCKDFYEAADKTGRDFPAVARCATLGAILTGDVDFFADVCANVEAYGKSASHPQAALAAEMTAAWIDIRLSIRREYPRWLTELDFSAVPPEWRIEAGALAAQILRAQNRRDEALAVARMLRQVGDESLITPAVSLSLRMVSAAVLLERGRKKDAAALYSEIAVESLARHERSVLALGDVALDVLRAKVLRGISLDAGRKVGRMSDRLFVNLLRLRGRRTGIALPERFSRRMLYIAQQLCDGERYQLVSERIGVSIGRMRNLVSELYEVLGVHSHREIPGAIG